jgi:transcriptional regulator with GAF, ATPase, and Fis domain
MVIYMPDPVLQDDSFFREAIQCVASSLDLPHAMLSVYEFLKNHFPVVGLTFHKYDKNLGALHLLFIVTEGKFHHLNEVVHLPEEAKQLILLREKECGVNYVPHTLRRPVTSLIQPAIHSYLPNVDRATLIAMLSANDRVIGHLNLFGEKPECFTPEHERKFSMLRPAFSLLMMNLLKHKEVFELQQRLSEENRKLVNEVNRLRDETIVGSKGGLRPVMEMVRQLSGRDVPVLVTGETGTGKELIADVIQQASPRSHAPYVKVNCGAIPDSLIDSELFGHEKGAFTGAVSGRPGRFEQAHGGTLFLDEVGDMPMEAQRRLLRVLQNGIVERVGGSQKLNVNARIIAATHRNIDEMIQQRQFRSDLFYRLNVFPVHLPPLRERQQDIPALIHHFLAKKARRLMLDRAPLLASESLPALLAYPWPGNVRELENLVERALIINHHGPIQLDKYLPPNAAIHCQPGPTSIKERDYSEKDLRGEKMKAGSENSGPGNLDDVVANHIRLALQASNGIIHGPKGAAKKLGMNPSTLRKRMDKLQIVYGRKASGP